MASPGPRFTVVGLTKLTVLNTLTGLTRSEGNELIAAIGKRKQSQEISELLPVLSGMGLYRPVSAGYTDVPSGLNAMLAGRNSVRSPLLCLTERSERLELIEMWKLQDEKPIGLFLYILRTEFKFITTYSRRFYG